MLITLRQHVFAGAILTGPAFLSAMQPGRDCIFPPLPFPISAYARKVLLPQSPPLSSLALSPPSCSLHDQLRWSCPRGFSLVLSVSYLFAAG